MIHRLPISVTAPILIGLPVLIAGVWLSVMWSRQSHTAVVELADLQMEQIHDMATTKVADVLSIPVRMCEVNGQLVQAGELPHTDLHSWRDTLVQEARAFDMLSAIAFGAADGRTTWVSRYADGALYWAIKEDGNAARIAEWRLDKQGKMSEKPTSEFDFDLFTRPWYKAPHNAEAAAWSEPYVWVGGEDSEGVTLGISYGIPIHDAEENYLGVIDAEFSLNDLSSFLQSMKIGKTGVAILATSDGRLLATSSDAAITSEGERLNVKESENPLIAATAQFFSAANQKPTHVSVDGELHYVRTSKVGENVGLQWNLVTIIPEDDFVAEINEGIWSSWLFSLFAVAVAVGLGFGAARWLVSPLLSLVTAVRKIGEGDLETRVQINHAPEYTKLGNEINAMAEGLQDRLRMRQSLFLAMEVQKNLLPEEPPQIKGLDIAGHSTYCDETGGDYYDFLDLSGTDDNTAVIAVGDVVGHGIAAAMLMATARGILRSRCAEKGSLADFMDHLNSMLVVDTRGERFMTMLLLTLSSSRHELRWASAGHGPPLVYNSNTDTFLPLDGGGLPLGLFDAAEFEEYTEPQINSGHIIVAATDGLWETMRENGDAFGMDRLRELVRANVQKSAAEISDLIGSKLAEFRGDSGMDDDLTFVIAKVL
jgi:sigma-B regulation protein RsbU (phosphoserine phosphatase)